MKRRAVETRWLQGHGAGVAGPITGTPIGWPGNVELAGDGQLRLEEALGTMPGKCGLPSRRPPPP